MDVKDRLLSIINFLNMPVAVFERRCGLSNGYIKKCKGNIGAAKLDGILTAFPDLNREWLLYGEGEMLNESAKAATEQAADTNVNASTIVGANVSGNGHTISNTTDSDNTALMELQKGFQNLLAKSQEQTTKAQEQIDELLQQHKTLISIIEKKL